MQILTEIAGSNTNTIIFPLDLVKKARDLLS